MERIKNQTHSKTNFLYVSSRMFERASFYGVRTLIVLYMIGDVLKITDTTYTRLYSWVSFSIVISWILGALIGDLLIGNKKAIIIGGLIQSLGAFSLCISSITGLCIGLFLIVLGNGLYTPNIISNFGKSYLNKSKLLDSGFTFMHLLVGIGALIGMVLAGLLRERYGYNIGFIVLGAFMLISTLLILLTKEKITIETSKNQSTISKRILNIFVAVLVVTLFWVVYSITKNQIFDLQRVFREISTLGIQKGIWQSMYSIFVIPITAIAILVWRYFYNTQFFKLLIGFVFGTISLLILSIIPEIPKEQYIILYFLSILFLSIAEIHILPIIYSILTRNSNPKFLAILFSLTFLPRAIIALAFSPFKDKIYGDSTLIMMVGIIVMIITSIGLFLYMQWSKKNYPQNRI